MYYKHRLSKEKIVYFNGDIIITDPVYIVKSEDDGTDKELFFLGKSNINFGTDWLDKGFFDLHIQRSSLFSMAARA